MAHRIGLLLTCGICVAFVVLSAACGGGSKNPQTENKVDDPAAVPSSTPIQNPPTFLITGNTIKTESGATATVGAGTTLGGGGDTGQTQDKGQTYTVVFGDTCSGIAAQFGVTLDALEAANGGPNGTCSTLATDDVMKIPAAATPSPTSTNSTGKTPTPGTGGGSNGAKTPTPSSGGGQTYTAQAGDTCYGIASSLGVDPDTFTQANANTCANLQEGNTLSVP